MEEDNRFYSDFPLGWDKPNIEDDTTISTDDGLGAEFDRLHEKDYSDKLIYRQSTLTEFEKAFIGERNHAMAFGIPIKPKRYLNKAGRSEEQSYYDYIGAPGGEEWPIPNTWEVNKIENVDDDGNEVNDIYVRPKQTIDLTPLQDVGKYTIDQWIKSLTGNVTERPKKGEVRDNTWENVREMGYVETVWGIQTPYGLIKYENLENNKNMCYSLEDFETGCSPLYRPNGKEDELSFSRKKVSKEKNIRPDTNIVNKDLDYSKLSNVNINKGQEDMFSYTNNSPAAEDITEDEFIRAHRELIKKEKAKRAETYRPLPDSVTIKKSFIDGLGLFAEQNLDKDVVLGISHHYVENGFISELIRTPLAAFCNHSTNPNCKIEPYQDCVGDGWEYINFRLVTIKTIPKGTEMTVDYRNNLRGYTNYSFADFLVDTPLENRIYQTNDGIKYYYNSVYGKFESTYGTFNNNPIFYTPEDAENFLKRVK